MGRRAVSGRARGIDAYEFFVDAEAKSLSHNQTFGEDTNDRERLESTLSYLRQKASKRVRDAGLHARTVTLTLRYSDFHTISRGHTFAEPSDLDNVFLQAVRGLFNRAWDGRAKLRLVGVEFSHFTAGARGQLDLIDAGRREKLEKLAQTADRLRDKFGFAKVQFGGSLLSRGNQEEE